MSIIYSYPTVQPTVEDLLIGTDVGSDNATKSFTVQSLVSLINAAAGSGTVTDVTINTNDGITALKTSQPGNPAIVYTVGLLAGAAPDETPTTNYFLKGNNTWAIPTVSAGILVFNQNLQITNDVAGLNFRGAGVVTTLGSNGNVIVQIDGDAGGVDNITPGTGISVNQNTGDVEITNTGVTRIVAGSNITLTDGTDVGSVEINSSGGTGGVLSITNGSGLVLDAESTATQPIIGIDYTGADTYITQAPAGDPAPGDTFAFQKTNSGVKEATFSQVPVSAFTLIEQAIADSKAKTVKYDTPAPTAADLSPFTFPSIPNVRNIVTLTDLEYTNLTTKNGNTLYLTATQGVPTITKTLNTIISSGITGTQYYLGGDQIGSTRVGPQDDAYEFITTITPQAGYEWAGAAPTVVNAKGFLDANSVAPDETTNLGTGTLQLIDAGSCVANLAIVSSGLTATDGAVLNTNYEITQIKTQFSGTCGSGTYNSATEFGVAVSLVAGQSANQWEIVGQDGTNPLAVGNGIVYTPTSGTVSGAAQTVTCTITGTVRERTYNLTYTLNDANTSTDYSIINSVGSGSAPFITNNAPGASTMSGRFSDIWKIVTTYSTNSGAQSTTEIDPTTVDFGNLSNNNTILSGGTLNGTFGQNAANITLNQDLISTTTEIITPPTFRLVEATDQGSAGQQFQIACAWLNQSPPDCANNPNGFQYNKQEYRINQGSWTPFPPFSGGYSTITTIDGAVVELRWPDPSRDNGFYVLSPIAYSFEINGTQGSSFTVSGGNTYNLGSSQSGTITNRLSRQKSTYGRGSAALACADQIDIEYWLQKGTGVALNAEVGDVFWNFPTDYGYPAPGFYKTAIGDGIGVNADATVEINTAGQVQAGTAVACPQQGTANLTTDPAGIIGPVAGYSIQPQYQVNLSGILIPHDVGDPPITANVNDEILWSYVLSVNAGYYAVTPLTSSFTNNPAVIAFESPQVTSGVLAGEVEELIQVRTTSPEIDADAACNGDDDTEDGWKTGSTDNAMPGEILFGDSLGATFAPAGWYKIFNKAKSFEVIANGVIQNVSNCS